MEKDILYLKWGTFKGCNFSNSPEALAALREYEEIGMSASAIMQEDTPRQKELVLAMIDKVNGDVVNSWTGETYTNKEDAKQYVINYRTKNT